MPLTGRKCAVFNAEVGSLRLKSRPVLKSKSQTGNKYVMFSYLSQTQYSKKKENLPHAHLFTLDGTYAAKAIENLEGKSPNIYQQQTKRLTTK